MALNENLVASSSIRLSVKKLAAFFRIWFQDGIAYKASGVIWVLTDVATAVTMPFVWIAAAHSSGHSMSGYGGGELVLYYLAMITIGAFVTSHLMWDLAIDIKEGQFTAQLLRPITYYQACLMRNLAWRMIRPMLFAPFLVLIILALRSNFGTARLYLPWNLWVSILLGHLVSFNFTMAMTTVAFYTTEVNSIFELYYFPMLFLSGQLFPVDLMPRWAALLSRLTPFYYTTGAPSEIATGRLQGHAASIVLLDQLAWAIGLYVVFRILWTKGVKLYTGVGM